MTEHKHIFYLCFCRYLNIYVGMPDVEESFNVTRPVSPHEVTFVFFTVVAASEVCIYRYVDILEKHFVNKSCIFKHFNNYKEWI